MPRIVRVPGLKEPLTFPTGTPDAEIYAALADKLFPMADLPEAPKEEAGFFGGLKEGITSLGQVPEALRYVGGPDAESRKAAAKAGEADYEFQQLKDIGGIGDLTRFVKEQAGQAVGFLAAPAAAAKTATMIAPGVAKPFAAGAAFLTTAGAQYFGETATRQAGEQERAVKEGKAPELPDATKIGLSAAGQAGLDLFGFKFFKPLGRLLGIEGKKAAESTAEEIAKTAVEKGEKAAAEKMLGKESIKAGMAKGAAVEAAQEPLQQLLERYGAGLDLANDDAISEYWQSAVAGGLLGAPLGGVSTYAGNVQKGVYDRKFVQSIQDGIMGRGGKPYTEDELQKLWSETEPNVLAEAPMMSLYADEFGNFKTYTPELLEQLGINPEAKAIGYGNTTLGMDKILGQETGNKDIASLMVNVFRQRMADLSNKFRTDTRMSPADRANLLTEYEQAAASYKSFLQMVSQRPIESAANFITRPHPKQKGKFRLVNALTGENVRTKLFESETDAQKYIRERIGKEDAAMARAQAQGVKKAGVAPSATVEETAKETPEQAAMRERAVAEATIKHRFKEDADQVFDLAQEMLDTGTATSYQEAINKASRIVDAQIKADKAAAKAEEKAAKAEEKAPVAPVAPEAGMAPEVITEPTTTPEPEVTQEPTTVAPEAAPEVTPAPPPPPPPKPAPALKTAPTEAQKLTARIESVIAKNREAQAKFEAAQQKAEDKRRAAESQEVARRQAQYAKLISEFREKQKVAPSAVQTIDPSTLPEEYIKQLEESVAGAKTAKEKREKAPSAEFLAALKATESQAGKKPKKAKGQEYPSRFTENVEEDLDFDPEIEAELEAAQAEVQATMKEVVEANGNAKEADKISKKLKDQACNG